MTFLATAGGFQPVRPVGAVIPLGLLLVPASTCAQPVLVEKRQKPMRAPSFDRVRQLVVVMAALRYANPTLGELVDQHRHLSVRGV